MADDKRLYRWVYWLLVVGLAVSGALLLAGAIASLVADGELPKVTLQMGEVLGAALRGDGTGLASLGVLSLMFAPVLVVIAAGIAAATQRDWRTVVTSTLVLAVMLLSTQIGR